MAMHSNASTTDFADVSQHQSLEEKILAAKARTKLYESQIQKGGIDVELIPGIIISIDEDLYVLQQMSFESFAQNLENIIASDMFCKSLVLTYWYSNEHPTPTVESLNLTLKSALMNHKSAQDVISESMECDFNDVRSKLESGEIKKIDIFSKIMSRMQIDFLSLATNGLSNIAVNESSLTATNLDAIKLNIDALHSMDADFCSLIKESCADELSKIENMLCDLLDSSNFGSDEILKVSAESFWNAVDGLKDTEERKLERGLNAEMLIGKK
jgi:hypothetical protein